METPLTPLEFARRTRWLHGHREGVVDGELRLTYEQFFDRWSAALQQLGVARGARDGAPKGVMISHRNATMNSIGTLLHPPIPVGEPYLWTLPMFHANGWTFTWTVTAAAATHVCLRKVEPAEVFRLIREEHVRRPAAGA